MNNVRICATTNNMQKSKQHLRIYNRPVVDLHLLRENEQCAPLMCAFVRQQTICKKQTALRICATTNNLQKIKQHLRIYNSRLRENEQCAHLCDNEQCAHLCDNEQFTQYAKKQTAPVNLQQACCRFASPARK
jgi:hypothetical protein